ncbi:hypothetical protein BDQ12DRAFT_666664 [Crucibulum laeve]|uniref:Ser-Thr-rich glycosyl-phosphatidyl-inositol-anchored membrane family-domain-containing protein n=1 Tax=Crucibulum laeve TaxID=68775 RepID=A0A5C3LWX1_9AGAR|nr:hypothetical protein BDQ12DRAFT_666664 [Crucibulum laeve]
MVRLLSLWLLYIAVSTGVALKVFADSGNPAGCYPGSQLLYYIKIDPDDPDSLNIILNLHNISLDNNTMIMDNSTVENGKPFPCSFPLPVVPPGWYLMRALYANTYESIADSAPFDISGSTNVSPTSSPTTSSPTSQPSIPAQTHVSMGGHKSTPSTKFPKTLIAGVSVSGLLFLFLIFLGAFFYCKRKKASVDSENRVGTQIVVPFQISPISQASRHSHSSKAIAFRTQYIDRYLTLNTSRRGRDEAPVMGQQGGVVDIQAQLQALTEQVRQLHTVRTAREWSYVYFDVPPPQYLQDNRIRRNSG